MNSRLDGLSCWLIRRAARGAPPALGERLEEEWLADLAARRGQVARLRLAVGCCWASSVIAHEHAAVAASPTLSGRSLTAYLPQDLPAASRRTGVVFLIVCLHGLVFFALGAGIVNRIEPPAPRTAVDFVIEPQTPPTPPPPLGPDLQGTTIRIDEPRLPPIPTPEEPGAVRDGAIASPPPTSAPAAPTPAVRRVVGGPGQRFPNTRDYYPLSAIHLGEEGLASVRVCVDERGRLSGAPTVALSSGSVRLDEGALKLARAGSGYYRPTTEDGRPVSSCYPLRIRFSLLNR
jgi:TonB family protein